MIRLVIVVILMAGCATLEPPPGKSKEDVLRDEAECRQCLAIPRECPLPGSVPGTYKACMQTKGYTERSWVTTGEHNPGADVADIIRGIRLMK